NSDGKLLPYLTANLQFQVAKRQKVLVVPNTALRWNPDPRLVAPEARGEYMLRAERKAEKKSSTATPHNRGVLWVEDGGYVRPVKVLTGISDGLNTEIVKGDIEEGAAVVIGETRAGEGGGTANPFAPKLFGKK